MAGKLSDELSLFIENTFAYIPYAVIGIFILLTATFTSVYLLKINSEVAETIYTTENNNPRQNAINLAFSTLLMGTLNLLLVVALQCLLRNLQRILRRRNSDFWTTRTKAQTNIGQPASETSSASATSAPAFSLVTAIMALALVFFKFSRH